MKKTTILIASCGLASGLAMAAQEQETESWGSDPEMTQDQSEYGTAQPTDPSETMGQQQEQQTSEYGTEQTDPAHQAQQHQQRGGEDLTRMSAEQLVGKTIRTSTGEEIGEIAEVWKSTTDDRRVAVVEVGGFLGIGEKTIAIPVSDLQHATSATSAEGDYQTSMDRSSIEAQPEFDDSGYTRESGQAGEYGGMEQDATDQEEDTDY